ncbi:MAG: DUF883 domain-containing protein [Verrucomicrobia bacterium]|nr:DUF883 domain-containing protein [Verrucomicrobiota bacterium]
MNTIDLNTEKLVTDLKRIIADSEELLRATADAVGEKAGVLRERLSETLASAKRRCHELETRTVDCAKAADQVVREHPYQSIGAAFGIGLLIGVLVTRK